MKKLLIATILFAAIHVTAAPIDFEHLADCIKVHENSLKYPYGCEYRVNGVIHGWPDAIARQKCIALCKKEYAKWDGSGDYFQFLNKVYAKDSRWFLDVEKLYNQVPKVVNSS